MMVRNAVAIAVALCCMAWSGLALAAERTTTVAEIKLNALSLGMREDEARRLITGRNFMETSPGDFYRQDGEDRFTRLQYEAVGGKITLVRLYLETTNGYFSALQGHLDNIGKALGNPDEHKAGADQRDPMVYDIYRDQGADPATLSVQIARGTERTVALFSLQNPNPGGGPAGKVRDLDLLGFKLGMSQEELTAVALGRGMSSSNPMNYRSPDSAIQVLWTVGDAGAQSISVQYSTGRQDPRQVPEVKDILERIDSSLGPDVHDHSILASNVWKYEFSDGFEREAPKLDVIMKGGANLHLYGDPGYAPKEMPPLEAIAPNPDIVAEAEKAMAEQAAMPASIAIDDAAVAGIRLGMSKEEAAAAAVAAGYKKDSDTSFSRFTDEIASLVNVAFDEYGVSKVSEQIKKSSGKFDLAVEKAKYLALYGRPSQSVYETENNYSGLFREESDTTRKELQINVDPYQVYLQVERRSR